MSTMVVQQASVNILNWNSMPSRESKLLPRLKESSDQVGSTESVMSAGSDHDDMNTEPAGGAYTTPPMTRKRKRLSMSPEVNEVPTDEVKEEMECLLRYVPKLNDIFTILNKIGEGTFSSVYLAKLMHHRGGQNQMYALKHIIPTSHPDRTLSELSCLTRIGGQDNVIGIQLCLRERDHVILAMPYFPHQKFQDYLRDMSMTEVKEYMYNLVLALRRVHKFNIIHRDVKPSNFLYNRRLKRYALVDFGLAQTVSPAAQRLHQIKSPQGRSSGQSSVKSESHQRRTRRVASAVENKASQSSLVSLKHRPSEPIPTASARLSELNINTFPTRTPNKPGGVLHNDKKSPRTMIMTKKLQQTTKVLSMTKQRPSTMTLTATKSGEKAGSSSRPRSSSLTRISLHSKGVCDCYGQPQVCALCMGRSNQQAPRAGTPGFRSPEVLMKYPHQTPAVDMWAAGVIFLSILSGRYPFFKAQDDMTALMQIMSILGTDAMVKAAHAYGKNLISGIKLPALNLKSMCEQLRNPQDAESIKRRRRSQSSERSTPSHDPSRKQPTPGQSSTTEGSKQQRRASRSSSEFRDIFPDSAYDLLNRLLDMNPHTRISADEALNHPFLAGASASP